MKTIDRRTLLGTLAAPWMAAPWMAAPSLAQPARPRNVVLMLIDDLGWKDLGCYGAPHFQTPNIDTMANESTKFTRFYSACPVCSPTRVSVLTGKYPARTGITDWIPGHGMAGDSKLITPTNRLELPLEEKTIAEYLKPLGYATASIGKWHLGGDGFLPQDQGFDLNIGGDSAGQPNSHLSPFNMPGLRDIPANVELTAQLTKMANRWIGEQASAKKPFFLYMPHFAVHAPIRSDLEITARYRDSPVSNPAYAAMIECVDNSVRDIRRQLKTSGVADDTLFIFTSDNGALLIAGGKQSTDVNPLRGQKGYLYEGGIRVPTIIKDPRRKPSVFEEPAGSVDLLPTILDFVGQPAPKGIDGTSIFSRKQTPAYYWHYPHYHAAGGKPGGAMMDGDWKLIEHFEDNKAELFNVKADIAEAKDLAAAEPNRLKDMRTRLAAWREETGAEMPVLRKTAASSPPPAKK
jgi:arylsulfatase A